MKKTLLLIAIISLPFLSRAQTEVLADTSLELTGAGGSQWASTSTNFMTSLCDFAGCNNCGGPCTPKSGTWFAWFGGWGQGSPEIGTLTQSFNLSAPGNANLSFWVSCLPPVLPATRLLLFWTMFLFGISWEMTRSGSILIMHRSMFP